MLLKTLFGLWYLILFVQEIEFIKGFENYAVCRQKLQEHRALSFGPNDNNLGREFPIKILGKKVNPSSTQITFIETCLGFDLLFNDTASGYLMFKLGFRNPPCPMFKWEKYLGSNTLSRTFVDKAGTFFQGISAQGNLNAQRQQEISPPFRGQCWGLGTAHLLPNRDCNAQIITGDCGCDTLDEIDLNTQQCADRDECASPSANTCGPKATCINRNFSLSGTGYDCECLPGTFYDLGTARRIRNSEDVIFNRQCISVDVPIQVSATSIFAKLPSAVNLGSVKITVERRSPDGLSYFPVPNGVVFANGTGWERSINFLLSGASYRVTMTNSNNNQVIFTKDDLRTSCACLKNCFSFDDCQSKFVGNGEPQNFLAIQNFGQILFSWEDFSRCDDSFQISRTEIGGSNASPTSFAPLYTVTSECLSFHQPESVQDSIARSDLRIGSSYNYCIEAVSIKPFMPEYRSGSVCISNPITIAWESTIRVQVNNQGGQGVKDVLISCFHGNERLPISCSLSEFNLTTFEDGVTVVHLIIQEATADVQNIIVSFSKVTASITHRFLVSNIETNEINIAMRHLEFEKILNVVDITSVPISGRVLVANTQDCAYPSSTSLKVCITDPSSNSAELECTQPDPFTGEYRLSATIGTKVNITITDGQHVFNRTGANITFPELISLNKDYSRIDFVDISTRVMNVSFVGGECNIPLGNAEFNLFLAASNCKVDVQPIRQNDLITFVASVPLHDILVKPQVVRDGNSIISENSDIIDYFSNGDIFALNDQNLRFEYHPPSNKVEVLLNFLENLAGSNCANQVVLEFDDWRNVVVSVRENYPKSRTCSKISGSVHWENKIGDPPGFVNLQRVTSDSPEKFEGRDRCYNGLPVENCTFGFETSQDGRSSFSRFEFIPGLPGILAKSIIAKVSILPFGNQNARNVTKAQDVFVLGMVKTLELNSVQLPTHKPLLVLRDPPGSRSFASYKNMLTTISIISEEFKKYKSEYEKFEFGGGLKAKIDVCLNFIVAENCQSVLDSSVSTAGISVPDCRSDVAKRLGLKPPDCFQPRFGPRYNPNPNPDRTRDETRVTVLNHVMHSDTVSLQVSWSASTGSLFGKEKPGKESDMFMVPTSSINFAKADIYSWNSETCVVISNNEVVWDLSKKVPAVGFVSYSEIKNHEIPELEHVLESEKQKGNDITLIQASINNWKTLLSDHDKWNDEVRENKTLLGFTPVTNLTSPQLLKNAKFLPQKSGTKAPTANLASSSPQFHDASIFDRQTLKEFALSADAQDITNTSRIVFSGGGSIYTFSETHSFKSDIMKLDPVRTSREFVDTLSARSVDFELYGGFGTMAGFYTKFSIKTDITDEENYTKDNSKLASTEVSFTLSDPDASDFFVIDVYRDPKFGTFAFHTIAGESKCPHEPGTIAIEEPEFRISKKPLHPILPGEQGEIEVEFRNKGSGNSSFELFMSNLENSGGLDIPHLRSPMALSGLSRERPSKHVFKVYRGPELYEYPPFNIGLRSVCESGIASQETISLSFLEACPSANLEVSSEYSFISKISSVEQGMQVFFSNPSQPYKAFSQVQRLQSITLEYRLISEMFVARTESLGWIPALGMNGQVLNLKTQENEGFVIWNTLVLPDGVYEYRLRSKCVPWTGQGEVSNGVNEFISESARLLIDKQSPKVSGSYEPADLVYFPGDELSVTFSENLDCAKPYPFIVKLNVHGMPLDTFEVNKNLAVFCKGNRISMDLDFDANGSIKFKDLMQKEASFYIEGVRDIAGNLCEKRIVHDFKFANIDQSKATIAVKNIQITGIADFANGLYVPGSPDWNTASEQILEKFSQDKLIPLTRLKMESFTYDNVFIATILVLPETQESLNGRRLQQQKSQEDLATQLTLAGLSIDLIPGTQDLEEQAPAKSTVVFQSGTSQRELSELKSSLANLEASISRLEASSSSSSNSNNNNSNALFIGLGVGLGSSFVLFGGLFLHSRRRMQQQIDEHRKSLPVVTLQHSTPALKAHVNV